MGVSKSNWYVNARKQCLLSINGGLFLHKNSAVFTRNTVHSHKLYDVPQAPKLSVSRVYLDWLSNGWSQCIRSMAFHSPILECVLGPVCVGNHHCFVLSASILRSWTMALRRSGSWLILTVIGIFVPVILFFTQERYPVSMWKTNIGNSNRSSYTDDYRKNEITRQVLWINSKLTHQFLRPLFTNVFKFNHRMENNYMHHNRWSLGIDKYYHPTFYWACDYFSILISTD